MSFKNYNLYLLAIPSDEEIKAIELWALNLKYKIACNYSPEERKFMGIRSPKYYKRKIKRLGGNVNE